mgnify:FL=1
MLTKASKAHSSSKDMSPITHRYHKQDIVSDLAENSGLTKAQISSVLDELAILIQRHLMEGSVEEFILAGLIKMDTTKKEAKEAYTGVNTFTGKTIEFSAQPAKTVVKVHALKGLKDMVK